MSASACIKAFAVLFNIIFLLLGFGFLGGGIFIKQGERYYQDRLNELQDRIPDIASGIGLTADKADEDVEVDLGSFTRILRAVLIVYGVLVSVMGFLGICGACCEKRPMLALYVILTVIIVLEQLTVLILFGAKVFDGRLKTAVEDLVKDKYGGIDDYSVESLSINYFMFNSECCGVDDYDDFTDSENWNNNRTLNVTRLSAPHTTTPVFPWTSTTPGFPAVPWGRLSAPAPEPRPYVMITPVACCATTGKFPDFKIENSHCTIDPDRRSNNWKKGCWNNFQDTIDDNKPAIYGVHCAAFVIELFCIWATIYKLRRIEKDNGKSPNHTLCVCLKGLCACGSELVDL